MRDTIRQKVKKFESKRGNFILPNHKKGFSQNKNSSVDQVLHLQRTIGNRAVTRLIRSGALQAKSTIGKPGDIYEKEADLMADRVMSMPETSSIQRKSTCPECPERKEIQTKSLAAQITPLIQRQAEEEEEPLQAKATNGEPPDVLPNIESNIDAMKGGGQPLSESTRSYFEPRFGADFSQVRVHTDQRAAQTAQAINAKAFTTGRDIAFNSGQYSPGNSSGKNLLAHELTHVLQQGEGVKNDRLHRQQNQGNQPQNALTVDSVVRQNITDANGNVIGMSGTQTVTYRYTNGREVTETHNVEWREDAVVEPGQTTTYEHPARVEQFDIVLGRGTRFPIQTTHTEGGIAIHGPGRSEGCIITGNAIRTDIQNRLNAGEGLRGEISNVTDARPPDQQNAAPIP